jgi:predicted nuclease with TOPRIM domain
MRFWTWSIVAGLTMALAAPAARAQEPPKYEELKKMYDSAVGALKGAQDAKNLVAKEKEELTKQVAELQKQLDAVTRERDELQRQATTYAEKTYNLRSYYATWQEFLKHYPSLHAKWKVFLEAELLKSNNDAPALPEAEWPFRVAG